MKSTDKESLISTKDYTFYEDERIWSKSKNRFLKGSIYKNGYVEVFLKCIDGKRRNFLWHRVIWFAFNGTIPQGMQVNHIDENKQNNALSNLNLMTAKENCNWGTHNERVAAKQKGVPKSEETKRKMSESCKGRKLSEEHKRKIGTKSRGRKPSEETKRKISESQLNNTKFSKPVVAVKDGVVVMEFPSTKEAGRQGFNQGSVAACCRNCYEKVGNFYKGYHWYFKEVWLKMQQATHERVACGNLNFL